MSKSIYHKHHIIPRHAGGTDDPSNIVKLTVAEHAEAHRVLYEKHGKKEDWLAWKGLTGEVGKEEIIYEIRKTNSKKGAAALAKLMKDPAWKETWNEAHKAAIAKHNDWGKWNIGIKRTDEAKENYRASALRRERVPCSHCGKGYTKPNINKHEKACAK